MSITNARKAKQYGSPLPIALISLIIFSSRIPFLTPGYGNDPDAWRVIEAARNIAQGGQYAVSRFPGNPVHEFACALLWDAEPFVLNGLTALLSVIGIILFMKIAQYHRCKDYLLAGIALAFIPVFYINSVNLMDYLWGLVFVLSSYYLVLRGYSGFAGIFLGLAVGCRITMGIMVIPLMVLQYYHGIPSRRFYRIILFTILTSITSILCFLPSIDSYGLGFFRFYDTSYPELSQIISVATVGIFGRLGVIAILLAFISMLFGIKRTRVHFTNATASDRLNAVVWLIVIILYLAAFLRLPHESAYLIPLLPFLMLVFAKLLRRSIFVIICILFISSSFVSFGRTGIYEGDIFSDHDTRIENEEFVNKILQKVESINHKSVIVVGWWRPKLAIRPLALSNQIVEYIYDLEESEVEVYLKSDYDILYLPSIRDYNLRKCQFDLNRFEPLGLDL
ncbi:MAG: hypothetical protein KOO62_04170 [candidate division Zixibacteria bacterium]|nr:hypothetical protein [candidate division Zixibacteria bacterium]